MARAGWILSLMGILPFAASLAAMLVLDGPAPLAAQGVMLVYGAIILTFLGGIHWGVAMREGTAADLVGSVVPSFVAFAAIYTAGSTGILILAAGFLAVLSTDWRYHTAGMTEDWFWLLRRVVSLSVLTCLMIAYAVSP
jgi:Protein of unknown function (DUF3429).